MRSEEALYLYIVPLVFNDSGFDFTGAFVQKMEYLVHKCLLNGEDPKELFEEIIEETCPWGIHMDNIRRSYDFANSLRDSYTIANHINFAIDTLEGPLPESFEIFDTELIRKVYQETEFSEWLYQIKYS